MKALGGETVLVLSNDSTKAPVHVLADLHRGKETSGLRSTTRILEERFINRDQKAELKLVRIRP